MVVVKPARVFYCTNSDTKYSIMRYVRFVRTGQINISLEQELNHKIWMSVKWIRNGFCIVNDLLLLFSYSMRTYVHAWAITLSWTAVHNLWTWCMYLIQCNRKQSWNFQRKFADWIVSKNMIKNIVPLAHYLLIFNQQPKNLIVLQQATLHQMGFT